MKKLCNTMAVKAIISVFILIFSDTFADQGKTIKKIRKASLLRMQGFHIHVCTYAKLILSKHIHDICMNELDGIWGGS